MIENFVLSSLIIFSYFGVLRITLYIYIYIYIYIYGYITSVLVDVSQLSHKHTWILLLSKVF